MLLSHDVVYGFLNYNQGDENDKEEQIIQVSGVRNCLEGNTISNPVNTGVTRMCGDYDIPFYILSGGQYIAEVA